MQIVVMLFSASHHTFCARIAVCVIFRRVEILVPQAVIEITSHDAGVAVLADARLLNQDAAIIAIVAVVLAGASIRKHLGGHAGVVPQGHFIAATVRANEVPRIIKVLSLNDAMQQHMLGIAVKENGVAHFAAYAAFALIVIVQAMLAIAFKFTRNCI